jgi:hypothetical protein
MKPFDFDCADGSSGGVTAWVASALTMAFWVGACATAVPVPAAGAACATVSGTASSACATPVSETPASAGSPHASSIFDAVPIVFCFFIIILVLC